MRKVALIFLFTILLAGISQAKTVQMGLDSPYFGNSKHIDVADFVGKKPLVLIFFYPECTPCEKSVPVLNNLYKTYKDKIYIIGISLSRDRYEIGDFIKENHPLYPIYRISDKGDLRNVGGILATPTVVVIDKNGKVAKKLIGKHGCSYLKKTIDKIIKEG
ncbi:TlpA family protein disulfide reductase [Hippea maritima]|uniref:Redoxin domain protein n=1 Tax=Hippea maritima (strain ATCC 700847 / DSM 10411 / MH2) TaxID=760142 RepID=F2LUJ5_HIPMA|nr:TlpA disulfide reductase family protein [Hippea maritima]AEA34585.1 Redoxin domain protein [Hippea maritima DSM 10411]